MGESGTAPSSYQDLLPKPSDLQHQVDKGYQEYLLKQGEEPQPLPPDALKDPDGPAGKVAQGCEQKCREDSIGDAKDFAMQKGSERLFGKKEQDPTKPSSSWGGADEGYGVGVEFKFHKLSDIKTLVKSDAKNVASTAKHYSQQSWNWTKNLVDKVFGSDFDKMDQNQYESEKQQQKAATS